MNKIMQQISSLTLCALVSTSLLYTPQARAVDPINGFAAAVLAHSIWTFFSTLPTDKKQVPNRYNMQEIKEACKELARGKTIKKNLNRIRKQMWYLYEDGLVGHGSKVGSIRYNEKTGITETPVIESRGVYGKISEQFEPIRGMAEFAAKAGGFLYMLEKSKLVWAEGLNPITKLANGLASWKENEVITAKETAINPATLAAYSSAKPSPSK